MPLSVISYLRSVLCTHGCLTCYMLLSVPAVVFTGLISHNPQAVHTHNPAAPTAIFIGLSFRNTQCLSNCKFLITIRSLNSFRFLLSLPYIYICNSPANAFPPLLLLIFLIFSHIRNRRSEFGIRLTRTRTTVIGRNSPNVMTRSRYIFMRKSITHFAYRIPPPPLVHSVDPHVEQYIRQICKHRMIFVHPHP